MQKMILGLTLLGTAALPAQATTYNAVHMTAASGTYVSYDALISPLPP